MLRYDMFVPVIEVSGNLAPGDVRAPCTYYASAAFDQA